jgi:outer membrane protein OmpA-like peptidoglycan-associated protein
MARASVQAAEETRLQATAGRIAAEEAAARAASAAREQAARDRAAQEQAARQAAELERQRAEEAARQATAERQQAELLRAEAEKARAEAQAQTARAESLRAQAEQDKASLRATLLKQFSAILDTHDTPRGLIVNIGDVLFETGRYELKAMAREKLARFSGLVLAHPGLMIQSEGFTDATGTLATNQKLSQQRADTVAQFLLGQGLPPDRVTSKGYGPAYPVASNDTRDGRSQNRRVELVVSGDLIGTPIGGTTTR